MIDLKLHPEKNHDTHAHSHYVVIMMMVQAVVGSSLKRIFNVVC